MSNLRLFAQGISEMKTWEILTSLFCMASFYTLISDFNLFIMGSAKNKCLAPA